MVLRVSRGILGHEQDAEDVFQATFLVLARKAATHHWHESVGSWLFETARRLAHEARTKALRRRLRESRAESRPNADTLDEISGRDLLAALDEEVGKLSEKYRSPLVLCCLEGRSGDEAAQQLGCSPSTLKRRLSRAREVLHARLERRGLALPAAAVATLLLQGAASAALPTGLTTATVDAALLYASGGDVARAVAANALALADGVLKGMVTSSQWKWAAMLLLALSLAGGASLWTHHARNADEANAPTENEISGPKTEPPSVLGVNRERDEDFVKEEHFDRDPGWEAFNFAGGSLGEIGGTFWRAATGFGYYADRVGPLTLEDRLEARGRVVLKVAAQQSDMFLGWFNSAAKQKPPVEAGNFLGNHIGGPSRVGHYFRPAYTMAQGARGEPKIGPVLVPDRACEWTLRPDSERRPGRHPGNPG
jgi:RNA polymerase sigma factor (sigma-70 family)